MNDKKQLLLSHDVNDTFMNDTVMIPCIVSGCDVKLSKLSDMTNHYNQFHFHKCIECSRCYPNERLLSLHVSELHDSYFHVMSLKKASYVCLVDGCDVLSMSDEARTLHLKLHHLYPKSFSFHHPIRKNNKKKKKTKSASSTAATHSTTHSLTHSTTDEMSVDDARGSSRGGGIVKNKKKNYESRGLSSISSCTADEMSVVTGVNAEEMHDASDRGDDMVLDELISTFDSNMNLRVPSHIAFGRKHKKGFIREKKK